MSLELLVLERVELLIITPRLGEEASVDTGRLISSSGTGTEMKHCEGAGANYGQNSPHHPQPGGESSEQ